MIQFSFNEGAQDFLLLNCPERNYVLNSTECMYIIEKNSSHCLRLFIKFLFCVGFRGGGGGLNYIIYVVKIALLYNKWVTRECDVLD